MITIKEESIPKTGGEIRIETASGEETIKTPANSNVPWWIIIVLLVWNALLTAGIVTLAVSRKKDLKK